MPLGTSSVTLCLRASVAIMQEGPCLLKLGYVWLLGCVLLERKACSVIGQVDVGKSQSVRQHPVRSRVPILSDVPLRRAYKQRRFDSFIPLFLWGISLTVRQQSFNCQFPLFTLGTLLSMRVLRQGGVVRCQRNLDGFDSRHPLPGGFLQ